MIVVIGSSGQLAQEISQMHFSESIVFLGRNKIDLHSKESINTTLDLYEPKLIINAAAYTAVDQAEQDHQNAFAVNELAVRHLAEYCSINKVLFIHISTDFVFDGRKNNPYKIHDQPNPINVYGLSKLAGELAIKEELSSGFAIIRTSWLYSVFGNNFLKTILKLLEVKEKISVVSDQISCPIYASGLSNFIFSIKDNLEGSTFHWCDLGKASWYEFALAINEISLEIGITEKSVEIILIESTDFKSLAIRPKYSLLQPHEHSKTFWKDNLYEMLKSFKNYT